VPGSQTLASCRRSFLDAEALILVQFAGGSIAQIRYIRLLSHNRYASVGRMMRWDID
jgi:hypothetical protein